MNKTVKTIAWICLVLGLLGLAVDVGVYVRGRAIAARIQESFESGEFPRFSGCLGDVNDDGDIYEHSRGEWPVDKKEWFKEGAKKGYRKGFDTFSVRHGGFQDMHRGFAFLFLLFAAGPVLTVIGAVTLIVNHEPKDSNNKGKKAKSKKS